MIKRIYTDDFLELIKQPDILLIDVREKDEFAAGHIPGAMNLPLGQINSIELPEDRELVFYCRSGYRSQIAIEYYCAQHAHAKKSRTYYDYKDGYQGYQQSQETR